MSNFPSGFDDFVNPSGTSPQNNPAHHTQHSDANDAIEALEAKVGVDNSAVTTSLDYKLRHLVAGSDTQVQFNDGGSFGADHALTYAKTNAQLTVGDAARASGTTAFGVANSNLTFTATAFVPGTAGNLLGEVDFSNDGANQALTIEVVGGNVVVHLATNGASHSTSTAADVKNAIEASDAASRLVTVAFAGGNGSGVIPTTSFDFVLITGGTGGKVLNALGNVSVAQADNTIPGIVVNGTPKSGTTEILRVETFQGDLAFAVRQLVTGGNVSTNVALGASSLQVKSPAGMAIASAGGVVDLLDIDDIDDVTQSGFNKNGYFFTNKLTEPDDSELGTTYKLFFWFDDTHGSAKLMLKGFDASGAIVRGSVNLS